MIVVIADDITGAAELAGAGFARGLASEVPTMFDPASTAELVASHTDSRTIPAEEAARRVGHIALEVQHAGADWIFKKVDSVLRGPVVDELTAILDATGKTRALLVPANPSLGRMVYAGQYLVDGRPVNQSMMGRDPQHPARSSDVLQILGATGRSNVFSLSPDDVMPTSGIVVGNAASQADLAAWAERLDAETLPAGAVEFFAAALAARGSVSGGTDSIASNNSDINLQKHEQREASLLVCGSATAWQSSRREDCRRHGVPVVSMPRELASPATTDETIRDWAHAASDAIADRGVAMMAIDMELVETPGLPSAMVGDLLIGHLTKAVELVLKDRGVGRLLVEGGQTASLLVRRLGWSRLKIRRQYDLGIVSLEPVSQDQPLLTVKPGSYPWPLEVWHELDAKTE